jgi:ectoine hydroxylase
MHFDGAELRAYAEDGFVVREGVFTPTEVAELREAAEEVACSVRERATRSGAGPEGKLADGHRIQFSSKAAIQWEWRDGSPEIRLIEPCDHLHPRLAALFEDPRLTAPACDALGVAPVAPFTSKLNLKRAADGSPFPYHQDFPYWWVAVREHAAEICTAVLLLDDARAENGALRVLPGSHRRGPVPRDPLDPTRFLADPTRLDTSNERVLELAAGSVVWFGAYLVHRSSPNVSGGDRRALLPSFQPIGRPRLQEVPYRPERVEELP